MGEITGKEVQMARKNVKKLQEQLKKLQAKIREAETAFFIEVGKSTLKWLQGTKDIADLEEKITQIKKKFGRD
jgi:peptidoglycan hydrolase CwlO-like protein